MELELDPNKISDNPDLTTEQKKIETNRMEEMAYAELYAYAVRMDKQPIFIQHVEAREYNELRNKIIQEVKEHTRAKDDWRKYILTDLPLKRSEDPLIEYFSEDRELLTAVASDEPYRAMLLAGKRLRDDEAFVDMLISQNLKGMYSLIPDILYLASDRIKDNQQFVLKAIKLNPESIATASERLKNDLATVLTAARLKPDLINRAMSKSGNDYTSKKRFNDNEGGNDEYLPFIGDNIINKLDELGDRLGGNLWK